MRLPFIISIALLPIVVTACQPPSARTVDVTLDAETTSTVLNQVAAEDTSIADAVDQVIDHGEGEAELPADNDQLAAITPPPEPETPPPPPPPSLTPNDVVGIEIADLIRRFGEPDYIRIDAGVEIYQYRLLSCVVDFVAMPVPEGEAMVVTSAHPRHRQINTAYDGPSCHLDLGSLDRDSLDKDTPDEA